MSLWRDDVKPPRAALVPVASLGFLALLSLSRVFSSGSYLAWGIPAVAVGAAFAMTVGRRSLGIAFGLLGATTAITLPALFARELTSFLLPTPAAYRLLGTLLSSGLSGVMREVAPVPPSDRYMIVLWTAGLVGGFLGASWVVVERPIGAIGTSIATIAYAGSIGKGPGRDVYAFGAVALVATFLLVDGRHRIERWSRSVRRVPPELGVTTLAVACLLALAGPAVLGAERAWLNVQQKLRPRLVVIKPLSDIRKQLEVDPPVEVMRVRATHETYWRLTALDDYTGTEWLLEAEPRAARNGPLQAIDPPTTGVLVEQSYAITSLLAPWLPAAFAAISVDSPVPFDVDRGSATLLLRRETVPGLRFTAMSRLPDTTPPVPIAEPLARPDAGERALADLARRIVGAAEAPYEQALALEKHFRGFRYDEKVEGGHTRERLDRFLADRRGYCEQFAATMALMLRGLGTPARVAVGFLPGALRNGEYVVSTKDAHAWVEANIPGAGWLSFDPTPGRGQPRPENEAEGAGGAPTPQPSPGTGAGTATPQPTVAPAQQPPGSSPLRLPVIQTLVVVAALSAPPGAKAYRRRRRRSGRPDDAVLGAYAELVDRLADLGHRTRPAQTQWELWRTAYEDVHSPGADAGAAVVRTAVGTLYGPEPPTPADADAAWRNLDPAIAAVRVRLPWWRRVAAALDPRTLFSSPAGRPPAARGTA